MGFLILYIIYKIMFNFEVFGIWKGDSKFVINGIYYYKGFFF